MQITTGTLTACSGQNHLTLPVTVNGVERDFHFTRDEILGLEPETVEEGRLLLLARLRSLVLEATNGVPSAVQVRNAVSNKTIEI